MNDFQKGYRAERQGKPPVIPKDVKNPAMFLDGWKSARTGFDTNSRSVK